jgi:hypothetical protein
MSLLFALFLFAQRLEAVGIPTFFIPRSILFECTTTTEPENIRGTFTLKKYTAIRGDVSDLDKAVISIGKRTFEIGPNNFSSSSGGRDVEIVEIKLKDRHIFLKLTGKPLSRNGTVRMTSLDQKRSIESHVTCH